MSKNVNSLDPSVGLLRSGTIQDYIIDTDGIPKFLVQLDGSTQRPDRVPISFPLATSDGLFIGTKPPKGTPIVVGYRESGQPFFVSFKPVNLDILPDKLSEGKILIQSTELSKISLDLTQNINIGSDINKIHIDTKNNFVSSYFNSEYHFTQGYREIGGPVKRDTRINTKATSLSGSNKLTDDFYEQSRLPQFIGLDPVATSNDFVVGATKNPPFIEHRAILYEFQYQSSIEDDLTESKKYTNNTQAPTLFSTPNRRSSRFDTMSLSLVAPNYLMEEVKGTVVDIWGNVLDINRVPLPIGKDAATSLQPKITADPQQSYLNLRSAERRSVAYHFEINARKDPNPKLNGSPELDISADNINAKMQRSRFFFDVDKEGQFKLNVPASSETGNVPLLVRYENYSTFGTDDNGNVNKTWKRTDNLDIFLDSFASPKTEPSDTGFAPQPGHGSISILNGNTNIGPTDRISLTQIQHGTAHHDILQTCAVHQNNATLGYLIGEAADPGLIDYINSLQNLTDIVSSKIQTQDNGMPAYPIGSGGANAGGRSGQLNLDGSIEMNVGANTVDRQSIWLDTAGGMVANIGRDRNQRSAVMNLDGDLIMQIGGFGVSGDTRFVPLGQDGVYNAVLDLRVFSQAFCHLIRVDAVGITVMTPGFLRLHGAQGLSLTSDGPMNIDCTTLTIHERPVLKVGASV